MFLDSCSSLVFMESNELFTCCCFSSIVDSDLGSFLTAKYVRMAIVISSPPIM